MEGENLSLKAVFQSWHVCPLPIHPPTHPHTLYTYNHNKKLFFKKDLSPQLYLLVLFGSGFYGFSVP